MGNILVYVFKYLVWFSTEWIKNMHAFEDPLYIYNIFFRNLLIWYIFIFFMFQTDSCIKKNIGTLKVLVRLYTLEISKHYHIFARIGTSVRIFFFSKKSCLLNCFSLRKKYNKRSYIFYTIDEKNWAANQLFKSKRGKRYFSSSIIFKKIWVILA